VGWGFFTKERGGVVSQSADTKVQGEIMKYRDMAGIFAILAVGAFFVVITVVFNAAYTAQLREVFK